MANSTPRLLEALEALEDGIYIINDDYVIEYMNKAMMNLFGKGVGKKCYELMNDSKGICPWCRSQEVLKGGKTRHREVFVPSVKKTFNLIELLLTNRDGTRSTLSIYRDITQKIEQEARLKSSEESYKRLFKHAGCGVFISSKQGRFLDVNPALLKMLGYENKEKFLSIDLATAVYLKPEDRRKYQEIMEQHGKVIDYEVEWKKRDGSLIQVQLTSNVRYDEKGKILGYEGIIIDHSQRKKMERKMKEAHDFLNKTISSSPNAIMAADMKGNMMIWNQGAEEILGYKSEDLIGKMNIKEIYSPGVAQKMMKMIRSNDYGGKGRLISHPITFENKKDQRQVEGNISAFILYDDADREIASVGIFVDLGEHLKMERKLIETRQHLLQSEKLAAMGRLTSQIAHELNNPLFGIMNTLELMKTEISPQNKRRRLLDMSLSETVRLADMLKKMLSFSKPDQVEQSILDLNIILEEILLLYDKRLRENGVKMRVSFMEAQALVFGSKDQLRQVFLNLFSNAMDAMPDGGVLEVSTTLVGDQIQAVVQDSGIGIKEEHQAKIFDSFFTTKTDTVKGVGLGLSVCYGFIKEHGGDIQVESQSGEGTAFTISLPESTPESTPEKNS